VPGRIRPVATVQGSAACHVRSAGRPAGPQPGGPRGRALPARGTATVARSPRGRWWLASGKVLPVSSRGPPGGRRATGVEAGLTEGGGRLRGWGGSSVQWRVVGSSPEGGSAVTPASSWSCEGGRER
jgi:hypothetical protein